MDPAPASPDPGSDDASDARVAAVRRFNRYYTRRIGILNPRVLDSDYSLTEMRILWEIAHSEATTASKLCSDLGLDPGYASRLLRKFRERRLVSAFTEDHDARQRRIEMTELGRRAMARLEKKSSDEVGAVLAELNGGEQDRLVGAMSSIEDLLQPKEPRVWPYELRDPRPGDYGWIIQRHGALYAADYQWDETFEGLVAEIVAKYLRGRNPERERLWIAERNGENVGCVLLVEKSAKVAQLRILLVEPSARGHGLGKALVDQCVRFARAAGYRKIVLWTQANLTSARRIYERAGFVKISQERHESFGHSLVGEHWELKVSAK